MKSPVTGKEMKPVYEKRTWLFRGETFTFNHLSWRDEESGEAFTTDESDTAGYVQVTNQYREKYGIPYTDQIVDIRKRYGLSSSKMSLILGFGTNQYRRYEQGEVPSISNGRMIASAMNPTVMLGYLEGSKNELSDKEYEKIASRVKQFDTDNYHYMIQLYETERIFASARGLCNGFACRSLERLKNILLYVLENCNDVFITKMNKILFYIDFLSYKKYGSAITGLSYRAIDYGPVPERWERVYCQFDEISQKPDRKNNLEGFILTSSCKADLSAFTEKEMAVMKLVCSELGAKNASQLSTLSHKEEAWAKHKDKKELIPFDEAFSIQGIAI
ncbi:MAG: DUF4065 domain-containing protein [Bacteroidales bacterium]|nr:DUF4065 domain-containing protein [Bacteroidales bacterium]